MTMPYTTEQNGAAERENQSYVSWGCKNHVTVHAATEHTVGRSCQYSSI